MDAGREQGRQQRIHNEKRDLDALRAHNQDLFGHAVIGSSDGTALTVKQHINVRTAVRTAAHGEPELAALLVEIVLHLPLAYPLEAAGVEVVSTRPLFLGAVLQAPHGGVWRGPLCPRRTGERSELPQLADTVLAAFDVLAGRGTTSIRDSFNGVAAAWWLEHAGEMPFDPRVPVRPRDPQPATREDAGFDLVEVTR